MSGNKITVEWLGLDSLIKDVRDLPKEVSKAVQKAQEEDLRDVASLLANYPPERPGQAYVRTGNLGFGWLEARVKTKLLSNLGFEVGISNDVDYSGNVQGGMNNNPKQDAFFRGRGWESVDDALAATEKKAKKRLDDAVQKALNDFKRKHS